MEISLRGAITELNDKVYKLQARAEGRRKGVAERAEGRCHRKRSSGPIGTGSHRHFPTGPAAARHQRLRLNRMVVKAFLKEIPAGAWAIRHAIRSWRAQLQEP